MMAHRAIELTVIWMRNKFGILMISFAILAAALAVFLMYNKSPRSIADEEAAFTLSASELVAAFSEDESEADSLYAGKVLEINGTLKEKILSDGAAILVIRDTSQMIGVNCFLRDHQEDMYRVLEVGRQVTVKGICNGLLLDLVLDKCIVKPNEQ
jgi:hypothetical protein